MLGNTMPFGRLDDGREVRRLVLGTAPGVVLHVLTLGATVHRLEVTGGDGVRRDVALGYATAQGYLDAGGYVGATVGRYANRIAGGTFELAGRTVTIGANDRGNALHGGPEGFDQRVWSVEEQGPDHALLRLESPDGDQGFPGHLTAFARYEVEGDTVRITLTATTSATTVVNLTNHAYLNLAGSGSVEDHELQLLADHVTEVDATGIPTGAQLPVEGTAFDFREPALIGPRLRRPEPQVVMARGIDHNVVLRGEGLRTAAVLTSPASRTRLTLRTDQPGLQVYTGNFLDGSTTGTSGALYRQGDAIAMEPQRFPDTPNHAGDPAWPSAVLEPGETYRSEIEWELTAL